MVVPKVQSYGTLMSPKLIYFLVHFSGHFSRFMIYFNVEL